MTERTERIDIGDLKRHVADSSGTLSVAERAFVFDCIDEATEPERDAKLKRLQAEVELARRQPAERYWEARWRDSDAECRRLQAALDQAHTDVVDKLDRITKRLRSLGI